MDINAKKMKLIYVIIFIVLVFSLVGATFSYWTWYTTEEQGTNVVFTLTKDFSCAADGGGDITSEDVLIAPTTCTDSTYAIQRTIVVTPSILTDGFNINMNLWLDINQIGEGFSNSENLMYALTTSNTSCTTGVISSGNFNGKQAGDQIQLLNKDYNASISETYYLYVWLDAAETSSATMRQALNLSLGGQCGSIEDGLAAPVLDDGMIPVTLSSDGTVTTILESDSNWYDYENKEWANVVLVDSDSRSTYQNTTGVTVSQDDILAYYVWIPRYKYQIWTTENSSAGSEQTIDIVFESASTAMSLGTDVGEYRTHPAFWWDDNSNGTVDSGETIAGIWVGKFETTGTATSPTILPNNSSLRSQIVSTQFTTSQKFSASGNSYGLSSTSTDAHVMKNSEWGAVAYLSRSAYGINDEIRINNNSSFITGCGASTADGSSTSLCEISYNSESTPQSTTGNITGVFDMSGGAWEYVMGVLADDSGNPRSGYISSNNSGYNGLLYDDTSYTSGISFPASKYYDLYAGTSSLDSCNGGVCYGHALSETKTWYTDYAYFVTYDTPWLVRGGDHSNGVYAGSFAWLNTYGDAHDYRSWRSVLVVGFGA